MGLIFALLAGLVADARFGEPSRGHPLVIFGGWADRLEARTNDGTVAAGARAAGGLIGGPVLAITLVTLWLPSLLGWLVVAGLVAVSIGRRALADHARPVAQALVDNDIVRARAATGRLVSRDTENMDAQAMRRATIESVLENSSDAIVAPLVWAAIGSLAGPPGAAAGVVLHRLANTLDAMWGYRTPRFEAFGRAAARLDDALNWPAARLTAAAFVVFGGRAAWRCWQAQAARCASPNAGPVMCAGAGALGITLGGPASYHGQWQAKPEIGQGSPPTAGDIERALTLVDRTVALVAGVIACWALL